jgi:hypothetical protein
MLEATGAAMSYWEMGAGRVEGLVSGIRAGRDLFRAQQMSNLPVRKLSVKNGLA